MWPQQSEKFLHWVVRSNVRTAVLLLAVVSTIIGSVLLVDYALQGPDAECGPGEIPIVAGLRRACVEGRYADQPRRGQ